MTAPGGTFSYSGNPADSRKDAIRALLGDTGGVDGSGWILSDQEIDYFDSLVTPSYDDPFMSAAVCADIIAGRYAGEVNISADGVSISADNLMQKYAALAASLRTTYKTVAGAGGYPLVGGIDAFTVVDPTVRPKNFSVGQDDNYRAGYQYQGYWGEYYDGGYYGWLDSEPW